MKNRSIFERTGFALAGWRYVWVSERSFRTECWCAGAALAALVVLRPGWAWAALIVLCIMLVLAMELLNSALEYLIDHVHPGIAPAVKHAKDAAAGAVLLCAVGSVCIAALMVLSVLAGP